MKNTKAVKNISLAISIFGLVFMVVAYILTDNQDYPLIGLAICGLALLVNGFVKKST
ncbi:MAG: hypothetical protein AAF990_26480 [Bacteroidota bacterium]